MEKVDVNPTAEAIRRLASYIRNSADRLDKIEQKMVKSNDISYAGEVMGEITGILLNGRLDLLVTRPIRAYEYLLQRSDKDNG